MQNTDKLKMKLVQIIVVCLGFSNLHAEEIHIKNLQYYPKKNTNTLVSESFTSTSTQTLIVKNKPITLIAPKTKKYNATFEMKILATRKQKPLIAQYVYKSFNETVTENEVKEVLPTLDTINKPLKVFTDKTKQYFITPISETDKKRLRFLLEKRNRNLQKFYNLNRKLTLNKTYQLNQNQAVNYFENMVKLKTENSNANLMLRPQKDNCYSLNINMGGEIEQVCITRQKCYNVENGKISSELVYTICTRTENTFSVIGREEQTHTKVQVNGSKGLSTLTSKYDYEWFYQR